MFASKLKNWRINNGLSQQDVADLLNYGLTTIQSWESGRKLPSFDALISIANVMGVSLDWLMGRSKIWKTADQILIELSSSDRTDRQL